MTQTSVLRVAAAFVAGIVVALGSALIYMRMNDGPPPHTAMQIPPATERTPVKIEPPPAEPAAPPIVKRASAPKLKPVVRLKAKAVVQVAQAEPKAPPAVVETPKPIFVPPPVTTAPAPAQAAIRTVNETEAVPVTPLPGPEPEHHVVTLEMGTTLAVRLGETLSTEHNYSGDTFRATLDEPIVIDGFIIAEKGSKVLGRVLSADKAGHLEGRANLSLALTEINTTDGQRVSIETGMFGKQGSSNAGEQTAKIAGGAALGAIIGAIGGGGKGAAIGAGVGGAAGTGAVLLTHGKPAVLTAETRLTFQLAKPAVITEKLN